MSNVDGQTPPHNTKNVVRYDGMLLCPACGSTQLHHSPIVRHFNEPGDQGNTTICFWCEECCDISLLSLTTTHGSSYLSWL